MRILLTSDLHYRLRHYDWLLAAASSFDAVVIAGDHIDGASPVPDRVQIAPLSASLAALAQKKPAAGLFRQPRPECQKPPGRMDRRLEKRRAQRVARAIALR
jgi:hypothetical protein